MDFNGLDSAFDVDPIYFWSMSHQISWGACHTLALLVFIYISIHIQQLSMTRSFTHVRNIHTKDYEVFIHVRNNLYNSKSDTSSIHLKSLFYSKYSPLTLTLFILEGVKYSYMYEVIYTI